MWNLSALLSNGAMLWTIGGRQKKMLLRMIKRIASTRINHLGQDQKLGILRIVKADSDVSESETFICGLRIRP